MSPVLSESKSWTRPKKVRAFGLTDSERANVQRAFRVLRARYGNEGLAKVLGVDRKTLERKISGKSTATAATALAAARVARVPVESILAGEWPKANACPHCGRSDET